MNPLPSITNPATYASPMPAWARWACFFTGFASLAIGIVLSPALLVELGPMRGSLTHTVPSVVKMAELEILVARVLLMGTGALLFTVGLFWHPLGNSSWLRALAERPPVVPQHTFDGIGAAPALRAMLALTAASLVYIGLASGPLAATEWVAAEDGLVEQLTAFAFLGACGFAALCALRAQPLTRKWLPLLLTVGFFLCFGEEISWGQRILGFTTPEAIAEHNVQGEVNLHNQLGYAADHIFILGIFLWGCVLPLGAAYNRPLHNFCDKIGLPLASPGLAVAFGVASLLHPWTVYRILPYTAVRIPEFRELLSGVGLALLMWQCAGQERAASQT